VEKFCPKYIGWRKATRMGQDVVRIATEGVEVNSIKEIHQWQ